MKIDEKVLKKENNCGNSLFLNKKKSVFLHLKEKKGTTI